MRPIDFLEAPAERLTFGMWVTLAVALAALAICLPMAVSEVPRPEPTSHAMPILEPQQVAAAQHGHPTVIDLIVP
ncbi:MAG: hypothetical protein ABI743_09940 [bacterium]